VLAPATEAAAPATAAAAGTLPGTTQGSYGSLSNL
jgi:hypothetical protein